MTFLATKTDSAKGLRPATLGLALLGATAASGCLGKQQMVMSKDAPQATPVASPEPAETPPEAAPVGELELKNPSEFARPREPVYVSYYDLGLNDRQGAAMPLVVRIGDVPVASEAIDHDGNGTPDGLFVLLDFGPAETKTIRIVSDTGAEPIDIPKLTQAEISHKVGGEWRPREKDAKLKEYMGGTFQNAQSFTPPPEHTDHSLLIRYEGPGIESDEVAYRIYLDERNGFDIFGKRVKEPVLQGVGLDGYDSYHEMAEWGMDILAVGASLGTGAFAHYNGWKAETVSEVEGWDAHIRNNGKLFSSFQIKYKGWEVGGKKLAVDAHYSMTGGSRLVHTRLELTEELEKLAIGVVKHEGTELVEGSTDVTGKAYTYIGRWGQQSLSGDNLGMAVLFRNGSLEKKQDDDLNSLAVVKTAGKEFDYYFLAAWEGEAGGGIANEEDFKAYLEQEVEKLTLRLRERVDNTLSRAEKSFPITAEAALGWSKRLADSELDRKTLLYHYDGWDTHRKRKPKFEYDIVGLQPLAYDELNQVAPDPRYEQVLEKVSGSFVTADGRIQGYEQQNYNIDAINPGRNLLRLYEKTKDEKYQKAAKLLRRQLKHHPRTREGAFWHKKKYPWQLWLDGVYMGMPFLAHYSVTFEDGKSLDEVVKEFQITREQLRDPATGLYYHAWDEKKKQAWADPETGRSKHFWNRGLGWFAMAVVDVLDFIPEENAEQRKPLLEIVSELAPALVKAQDETGTWWQILDKPKAPGNYRESSGSAMFAYFFAKATRKGYLPESYEDVALRSYEGLIKEFVLVHQEGKISMTNQCLVGGLGFGRDGTYHYYMSEPVYRNDPKGNGPFILAGVEVYRMLEDKP